MECAETDTAFFLKFIITFHYIFMRFRNGFTANAQCQSRCVVGFSCARSTLKDNVFLELENVCVLFNNSEHHILFNY